MEENLILSEEASNHYRFFDFQNKNVLDLGCGRYGFDLPLNEYTPIHFGLNGANKVVGVEYRVEEIEFYKNQNLGDKFIFIQNLVNGPDVIRNYLNQYDITAIKCDIEGDERYFEHISSEDMKNVVEVAFEYHTYELRDLIYSKLEEWGFVVKNDLNFINTVPSAGVIFANK